MEILVCAKKEKLSQIDSVITNQPLNFPEYNLLIEDKTNHTQNMTKKNLNAE